VKQINHMANRLCILVILGMIFFAVNSPIDSQGLTEISTTTQFQVNNELCPPDDLCLTQWRVVPDGLHYVVYSSQTQDILVVSTDDTSITRYNLSEVFPVQSTKFDFEPLSATELLLFDSASSRIYLYNLTTEVISEYIPNQVTSCTFSAMRPSRSMLRPLGSAKLVICGVDGNSRYTGVVDLQSSNVTIHNYINFPVKQQNIQPWENVVIDALGNIYAVFSATIDIENYPDSTRNDPNNFVLSTWDVDNSLWHHMIVPTAQLGDNRGQFVGVDNSENYYFYQVYPSKELTVIDSNGQFKYALTSEILGEYHDFIGIYPDGSLAMATYVHQNSTVGLQIEIINIKDSAGFAK